MKKVMMTLLMSTLLPISGMNQGSTCLAEDVYTERSHYPDVAPVYNSYYEYSDGYLYIYSSLVSTEITVNVFNEGKTIISDIVSPGEDVVKYDFNNVARGTYTVTLLNGTTVLTTFNFVIQ